MTTYVVTSANWSDPVFWTSVNETATGQTLDFSGLDPAFTVQVNQSTGVITINDGATSFTVGEAGVTGTDTNFGGATQLDYFTSIQGAQGQDVVTGTTDSDVLDGNSGADSLAGDAGADTIYGNGGADTLGGDAGRDTIYGGADGDSISGGTDNDQLFGETGNDTLDGGSSDDFVNGGAGADLIYGGDGADHLEGGWEDASADTLFGDAGNDLIFSYGGNDSVFGGTGNDWIDGGAGDDHLEGNADNDRIVGDLGNDTILGGDGYDVLTGGEGADYVDGGGDADQIWGNAGETIFGGETGDDSDTLFASYVDFITYVTSESGTITFNSGDTLQFSGIEHIIEVTPDGVVDGTSGDDQIGQFEFDADGEWIDNGDAIGESDADSVRAGDGNDTIWSSDGADTVHGEAGDDQIYLGNGDNVAFGGSGADTIEGEWNNDTISTDDVVATGPNLIFNGSFENTTGMNPVGFGFSGPGGIAPGWTDANGIQIEFDNTGRNGLNATDGTNWLDMEASGGQDMVVSQTVADIDDGQVYLLSFDAADFASGDDGTTLDNQLQLIWNGEVVGNIDPPDGSWRSYEFHLIGGSGDGSNTLALSGSGRADNQGASLDNVQMYATTEAAGGADSVNAWTGDDDIITGAGNDTVDAGDGNDMVVAGSGDDSVLGGDGADTIWGGTGDELADAGGVQIGTVSEEDFATAATGWFDTATGEAITDTAALNDGNAFLGNFAGNGTGAEQVSKTFTMIEGATSATISFDFLKFDSWDENNGGGGANEQFTVYIDGVAAFSFTPDGAGTGFGDGADASGSFAGGTWSVTSSGSDTEMFGTNQANWGERVYEVQITLDNPGDTVTMGIGTTLSFDISDESWGIDNVLVEATGTLPADGGDTVDLGDGDDVFTGSGQGTADRDLVLGGAGNDTITVQQSNDTVYGGDGDDVISSTGEIARFGDELYGEAGNDTITGANTDDTIDGGTGDDSLSGGGNTDTITGGEGADTIDGGDGNDLIYGDHSDPGATYYITDNGGLYQYEPGFGTSTLLQTGLEPYGDIATGSDGSIYGVVFNENAASDAGIYRIDPDTGTETLVIDLPEGTQTHASLAIDGAGNLYVNDDTTGNITRFEPDGIGGFTSAGNVGTIQTFVTDIVFIDDTTAWATASGVIYQYDVDAAGNFTNEVNLGTVSGQTDIFGLSLSEDGTVRAFEGSGEVWSTDPTVQPLVWSADTAVTLENFAEVWGTANVAFTGGNDSIDGGSGNDTIYAGVGNDTVAMSDSFGTDSIVGGEDEDGTDIDVLDASGITAGGVFVNVTNEAGTLTQGANSASFSDIESFVLTDQNDTLTAFGNDDLIVDAGAGDDSIREGNGQNTLSGGEGDDIFEVGFGTSTVDGGAGSDTLSAQTADDAISVTFDGTGFGTYDDLTDSDGGSFTAIEAVHGTSAADNVNAAADAGGVDISGFGGNDTLSGGSGADVIAGGDGADSITANAGDDTVIGGGGRDYLDGGDGADLLVGDNEMGGTFGIFALTSAGDPSYFLNGTFTFNATQPTSTIQVADDESAFEDSNDNNSTMDTGTPQVLTQDLTIGSITYPAGTEIHAIAQSDIENLTTGETGNAWLLQVGPNISDRYWSFDIAVNDGDQINWTSSNIPGVQDQIFADASSLE